MFSLIPIPHFCSESNSDKNAVSLEWNEANSYLHLQERASVVHFKTSEICSGSESDQETDEVAFEL